MRTRRPAWPHFCVIILLVLATSVTNAKAQGWSQKADTLQQGRFRFVSFSQAAIYSTTYAGLHFIWYAPYRNAKFHWFNDGDEWLQMDKVGHATTAYSITENLFRMNRWTGMKDQHAMLWSVAMSQSYQMLIEVQDGFSTGWGFSLWDVGSNVFGGALFAAQQQAWKEQRIRLKFSFYPSGLSDLPGPEGERARNLYGSNLTTQWLKDYNGQTYWLSANVWSVSGRPRGLPRWLNLALGYSADGILGGTENTWMLSDGAYNGVIVPSGNVFTSQFKRQRQFLLSLDIDLDHVPLPRYLMWLRPVVRIVKFPLPTLEWNSKHGLQAHAFYF